MNTIMIQPEPNDGVQTPQAEPHAGVEVKTGEVIKEIPTKW